MSQVHKCRGPEEPASRVASRTGRASFAACISASARSTPTPGRGSPACRDEDGSRTIASLGYVSDAFGFDEAKAAAEAWFKNRESGVTDEVVTVEDACREYVTDRRREKGEATGHDAECGSAARCTKRRSVAARSTSCASSHVKEWREGLGLSPAASNRTLIALKAALNLAVTNRRVAASQAIEWASVKPIKGGNGRRDLYLDLGQRRALLASCEGAVRDLIEAAMVTGARAGELVNATRSQFDARTGSMTFIGKTGIAHGAARPAGRRAVHALRQVETPGSAIAGARRRQAVGAFRLGRARAGKPPPRRSFRTASACTCCGIRSSRRRCRTGCRRSTWRASSAPRSP